MSLLFARVRELKGAGPMQQDYPKGVCLLMKGRWVKECSRKLCMRQARSLMNEKSYAKKLTSILNWRKKRWYPKGLRWCPHFPALSLKAGKLLRRRSPKSKSYSGNRKSSKRERGRRRLVGSAEIEKCCSCLNKFQSRNEPSQNSACRINKQTLARPFPAPTLIQHKTLEGTPVNQSIIQHKTS